MRIVGAFVAGVLLTLLVAIAVAYSWARSGALNARNKPSDLEYDIANYAMSLSIPASAKGLRNPLPASDSDDVEARRLFSDNCSVCHGIDGTGKTTTARGLSPEVPDLHAGHIQQLTDGELFYIIKNGVRFTGMPGWDFRDDQIWRLVALVRRFKPGDQGR